jgi:putative ABC transport system permease protein
MIFSRIHGSTHERAMQSDLNEELRSHLEMLLEEKTSKGIPSEEARRLAMLELGNSTQIEEAYRKQARIPFLEVMLQDITYGLRLLRRYPGFSTVAIVTLALGIGANTAIFSIVNGVLLRPLPYDRPEQLVAVTSTHPFASSGHFDTSPPDFRALRAQNHTLSGLSGYYGASFNLTGVDHPERLQAFVVSSDYFSTLGVQPAIGRNFSADEEQWGRHQVAVVTDGFWRTHLNADRNLSGKTLNLDGELYNVVGVMPPGFYVEDPVQLWVPMAWKPDDEMNSHNNYFISMVGRLRPGVSKAQARADLKAIMLGIAQQFPENKGIGADLKPLHDDLVGDVRPALMVLLGAVGFVLLIACVNLANLLLARSSGRQREIAVRSALGANRSRLLRQFITESLLLSCIGGAIGLGLASLTLDAVPLSADILPRAEHVRLDGWVLFFTVAVSALTGLLFGLMPALQSSRSGVTEGLREGGRNTSSAGNQRLRSALAVSEVALALLLLIGSGLAIKSFSRLLHVNPGFSPDHVLSFVVSFPDSYDPGRFSNPLQIGPSPRMAQLFETLVARIEQLPGVKSAGLASALPLRGDHWGKFFAPLDRPAPPSMDKVEHIQYTAVFGHYFEALQIPLIKGRFLNDHDRANSPRVVVVNQTLAQKYWPNQDPIGKTVLLTPPEDLLRATGLLPPAYHPPQFSVVGVAGDVHYGGMDNNPAPLVYAPVLQNDYSTAPKFTVRTDRDPRLLTASIREVLKQVDGNLPMANVRTMDEIISTSVAQPRLEAILLGAFGGLALLLASVGIYGVLAYSVSQRTSEIGIRMALGASRASVLRMVLGQGLRMTAMGLAIGLVLALALTRVMSGILFGISPTDPATFLAILFLLAAIAVFACYLPARRATRVDPMVALRYE